jgi:Fe2+ transport system protein FeoA
MPSTNSRNLTLTTVGSNVTIQVTYNAVFSSFERKLAELGLVFRARIRVIGEDLGTATDVVLYSFPIVPLPVPAGPG